MPPHSNLQPPAVGAGRGSGGLVRVVGWGTPAWKAGLVEGSTIVAIDDIAFADLDDLATAIRNAASTHVTIRLLVRTGRHLHTVAIAYDGGLRYPHLVRDADAKSASLDAKLWVGGSNPPGLVKMKQLEVLFLSFGGIQSLGAHQGHALVYDTSHLARKRRYVPAGVGAQGDLDLDCV